jgi:hypothetical protein
MMEDVLNMGIALKASQTMIPIYNILADRHSLFATGLQQYANGGDTPSDCYPQLEQMFSDICRICTNVEFVNGKGIWHSEGNAYSAEVNDKGKGKGKDKRKGKGKGREKGKGSQTQRAFEGRVKGNGNDSKRKRNENAKLCSAKDCDRDPGHYKFCAEHWKKGMEDGQIVQYDGTIKKVFKDRYGQRGAKTWQNDKVAKKDKDAHHFDTEQMKGLSAIGEHMMSRTKEMIEAHMGSVNNSSPFQIMPPPTPPQGPQPSLRGFAANSVFQRISDPKDSERDAKKIRFMDALGKHEH